MVYYYVKTYIKKYILLNFDSDTLNTLINDLEVNKASLNRITNLC